MGGDERGARAAVGARERERERGRGGEDYGDDEEFGETFYVGDAECVCDVMIVDEDGREPRECTSVDSICARCGKRWRRTRWR